MAKGRGKWRGPGWGRALGRADVQWWWESRSSPAAWCLHFGARGKIHLPRKANLYLPAPQPGSSCMSWLVAEGWAGSRPGVGKGAGSQGGFASLWGSSHAERTRAACAPLPGQSHRGRQVPNFCLQPHLKVGQVSWFQLG